MTMTREHTSEGVNPQHDCPGALDVVRRRWSLAVLSCFVHPQQFSWINLQHPGDLFNRLQARIVAGSLKRADIGPIKACLVGKILLREPFCYSGRTKIPGEKLAYVHGTYNSRLQSILHGVYSSLFASAALSGNFLSY